MKKNRFLNTCRNSAQEGSVAAEFALGLLAFMVLVLAALQAMTYSYQLSVAGIATERAAREVSMCKQPSTEVDTLGNIKVRAVMVMRSYMPNLDDDHISVTITPSTCGGESGIACELVTVHFSGGSLSDYKAPAWAPFSLEMPLPASALRTSHPFEMPVTTC